MRAAVIGAGNGGLAMAAHLTTEGHEVALFSRTRPTLAAIEAAGGVGLSGLGCDCVVPLAKTTDRIADAIEGARVVIVTVPGMVQEEYLDLLVPEILPNQAVWFCPGNSASLIARPMLLAAEKGDVLLIESNTLAYAARATGPAEVKATHLMRTRCAAFPAARNDEAMSLVRELYPLPSAPNVLDTTLNNVNPMIHILPSILNMGVIDARDGQFSIYGEGMAPVVLRSMGALDRERLALLEHFGLDVMPLDSLYEELETGPIYREAMAVGAADRYVPRFLSEDVPVGLVTWVSLGREHGIPTPLAEALVTLAETIDERDYRSGGRTSAKLGLEGMSVPRILDYLERGE